MSKFGKDDKTITFELRGDAVIAHAHLGDVDDEQVLALMVTMSETLRELLMRMLKKRARLVSESGELGDKATQQEKSQVLQRVLESILRGAK